MTGTVNKKKTSVQRKLEEIRTYKNRRCNLHRLILQQKEWGTWFDNIQKERQEARQESQQQRPRQRWIFADSFDDKEEFKEEDNTGLLVKLV